MRVSEDQRALLQLLLEAGQSYEDISGLLGVPVEEVRTRAARALETMQASELARDGDLVDLMLGQTGPGSGETALERLAADPGLRATARRLTAQLTLLFPGADLPRIPEPTEPGGDTASAPPPQPAPERDESGSEPPDTTRGAESGSGSDTPSSAGSEVKSESRSKPSRTTRQATPSTEAAAAREPASGSSRGAAREAAASSSGSDGRELDPEVGESSSEDGGPGRDGGSEPEAGEAGPKGGGLSGSQTRLLAVLLGSAFVLVAIVLGVTGTIGGGNDGGGDGGETAAPAAEETAAQEEAAITRAVLRPTGGGERQGVAILGNVEGVPVLQVTAAGLAPAGPGEEYSIWLYRNDRILLRLTAVQPNDSGQIATQIQLPEEVLALVVNGAFNQVDVSRNRAAAYRSEVQAAQRQDRLPAHVGTSVLRGPITGLPAAG